MSSEEPLQNPAAEETSEKKLSKKELAKLAKTSEKKLSKQKRKEELAAAAAAAAKVSGGLSAMNIEGEDPLKANYGDINLEDINLEDLKSKEVSGKLWTEVSGKLWTEVGKLNDELKGKSVLVRGQAQAIRAVGKKIAFVVLREGMFTVQCVLTVKPDGVSSQMVKFTTGLSRESVVDIEGEISVPDQPITGATQQVEIQVRKLHCLNRAQSNLPFNIEDAARSEVEIERALQAGEQLVRVNQDTRLNFRVLDLRTPANQAIFGIQGEVENIFRQFLRSEGFKPIHTPKSIAGSSEGGSAVFRFDYKGKPACLAQSPQLHKQMSICASFPRVFEVGTVFRAEDSFTHRHLCEFIGLDVEMEIKQHYSEVMDVVGRLFVTMFDYLNANCSLELEAINRQYPFEKLKYLRNTLRLTFEEGVQMLKEAGVEIDPLGDLNTESERKLGQLVLEKYGTEFYILHRYPLAVRPFYTMPCHENEKYSNSFDVFIRGEEIISGAQRIHEADLLTERATKLGIDGKTISTYIDSFRYGVRPHGGFGAGLERVVMLFCALNNIRKTSLFPRDPQRLVP